jgi:uncharacterized membrane protein YdbT with pleckstrin-like domain
VQVIVQQPGLPAEILMRQAAPIPAPEQTIWEGRSALAYYMPGMIWSGLWIAAWLVLAAMGGAISKTLLDEAAKRNDITQNPVAWIVQPMYVSGFFLALALWAAWRLVRRILIYLNTYYIFTTQRLRLRQGVFSRAMTQVELFRVKDFAVVEPLWGRLFGYAHIRIISSDRVASDTTMLAVPGGVKTMDQIRSAAQWSRAETGTVTIHE